MITQHNEITLIFVDQYAKISKDIHMKSDMKKKQDNQSYNEPFTSIKQKKSQEKIPYILG